MQNYVKHLSKQSTTVILLVLSKLSIVYYLYILQYFPLKKTNLIFHRYAKPDVKLFQSITIEEVELHR